MEYRERLARMELLALAGAWVPYFVVVWVGPFTAVSPRGEYFLWAAAAIAHALLLGVGRGRVRRQAGEEGAMPADERDLAIRLRSYTIAYYTLIIAIMVFVVLPFITVGVQSAHLAIFAYILSAAVRTVVVIRSYRKQSE